MYELNARAGDAFAAAQGGRYAAPAVTALVARLRGLGVKGVGQSSWGPTVFAVVRRGEVGNVMGRMSDASAAVAGASP